MLVYLCLAGDLVAGLWWLVGCVVSVVALLACCVIVRLRCFEIVDLSCFDCGIVVIVSLV